MNQKTTPKIVSQALIRVKSNHAAVRRSKKMDAQKYEDFCQSVTTLYGILDQLSVEQIERMFRS